MREYPRVLKETYLGDGLYASFDGWQVYLRAPREEGDHWVALEPPVVEALIEYIDRLNQEARDVRKGISK